jgi:hypothetical protein
MKRIVLAGGLAMAALGVWGCESSQPKKNPRELLPEGRKNYEAFQQAMIRNALKSDMALADAHFEPHSAKLSGLGEHRLQQFAEILTVEGGTVHVENSAINAEYTEQRIASAVAYLSAAGVARERIEIVPGQRQGRGMAAAEAIQVRERIFDPNADQLTTLIGGGTGGGMGSQ